MARFTICQQLVSILQLLPTHVNEFASFPDWVNMFLWLLTPSGGNEEGGANEGAGPEEDGRSCYSSVSDREEELPVPSVQVVESEDGDMTSSGFRGRLSAFVHPSSLSRGAPARQSQSPSPHPSPRAQRRWRKETKQSDDVLQTFHIVTETIGYILWHSVEFGRERPPWRVWGCIFCSIDTFSSQHTLLFPEFYIKQRYIQILYVVVYVDSFFLDIMCVHTVCVFISDAHPHAPQVVHSTDECSEAGC